MRGQYALPLDMICKLTVSYYCYLFPVTFLHPRDIVVQIQTHLGESGPRASAAGLGCMANVGLLRLQATATTPRASRPSSAALEAGVDRCCDTADFYGIGHNELLLRVH